MKKLDLTLYLVAGSDGLDEAVFLKKIEDALRGGVTLLQLREKEKDASAIYRLAVKVGEAAKKYGVPLIIDDRADIAFAAGADGVHVGQCDLPVSGARRLMNADKIIGQALKSEAEARKLLGADKIADAAAKTVEQALKSGAEARKLLGADKIVGATAKTVEQALKAEAEGADYVGVGAIYPTTTKVKTVLTPVSALRDICAAVKIPAAAIGGLNKDNIGILAGSGFSGIAVVTAIMKAADTYRAASELKEAVLKLREKN
ncbi:MAG: thiamine phosphate synthase [Clostridiales bacterium]|jgi:thiamine-phosphate pyrophosphorylase|nr:thiamine phosphate synthase [Clostridiales bacterium]